MPTPSTSELKPIQARPRPAGLVAAALLCGLALSAGAQEPAPSPAPKPSVVGKPAPAKAPVPSPRPGEPVVVVDPVIVDTDLAPDLGEPVSDADAARIEAEVERAQAAAQAAQAEARRMMENHQGEIAEAMAAAEREARAGMREALQAAERDRSEVLREAIEAQQEALANDREARERALEQASEEREKALEKAREDREKAQEKAEKEREKAREKAERDRERARDQAEATRERERERAQAAREKAQEARERQRERSENVEDLYEQAMDSIDDEDWNDALRPLSRLVSLSARMDAALYWMSYAQGKLDRTGAALENLARLQKEFPTSRWAKEGKALELEVRGRSGQVPRPDQQEDLDLKLMAVSALAQTDPQEAMPVLTKILASPSAERRVRERSLFVLAQIGSEQAASAIAEVAKGNSAPELQRKAIQYLGVFGGANNRKVLSDIYVSNTDNAIRKQILNSFMVSGDKARVLSAAKTEKDPGLRADAVRLLGVMSATSELSQMYATARTTDEKKAILHALFLGGAVEPIAAAAKTERDKEVRLSAVRNLGLMGRKSQDTLGEMYRTETDPEVKKEVLNAFFLQNNAARLVDIARTEKDPTLKKEAVHWLSLMNSKEARAYMLELLKD